MTDTCGCCQGIETLTPARVENDPGLSAVLCRVGTHGEFKRAMQTALARSAPLHTLTTRDDDDAALGLIDATATVLDVLTFYQERIANEGYLRTATERRSLLELARAIGYELGPGTAAETHVAFTLDDAPGAPRVVTIEPGTRVQSIPGPGEEAQTFETVEEIEARREWNAIRPRLTEPQVLSPPPSVVWLEGVGTGLRAGDRVLVWGGAWTVHRVHAVAPDQEAKRTEVTLDPGVAIRTTVPPPAASGVWALPVKSAPFGHNAPKRASTPSGTTFEEWQLDEYDRANPSLLTLDGEFPRIADATYAVIGIDPSPQAPYLLTTVQRTKMISRASYGIAARATQLQLPDDWQWESLAGGLTSAPAAASWAAGRLDVFVRGPDNALWHKWYQNGWSGWESLGGVLASDPAVASWGSGRLDVFVRGTDNALWHKWYQNGWSGWESLEGVLTSAPAAASWAAGRLDVFVRGTDNALWHKWYQNSWSGWESLGGVLTSAPGAASSESGRLDAFVRGTDNALWHKWYEDGWSGWKSLGGVLTSAPAALSWSPGRVDIVARGVDQGLWRRWLFTHLGPLREMVVYAQSEALPLSGRPISTNVQSPVIQLDRRYDGLRAGHHVMVTGMPLGSKESVVEAAVVSAVSHAVNRTTVQLAQPLAHPFVRTQVTFNANLALATHGETRGEILGSGDASQPFQSFTLKQPPLTYVQATTPSGGRTTLAIRVNDLLWHEVPSLYGAGPTDRVYVTRRRDDGKVEVLFGDGKTGARLPTGTANVVAAYRVGVGVAANLAEGTITTLLSRPLGLREVRNPSPARGGSEPETRDRARRNAPLTVRTIDRVVSLLDYEDFASAFAGVGKAQAIWLWNGRARVVHLTIAGDAGEVLDAGSPVRQKLLTALEKFRDPLVHARVDGHQPLAFSLNASVRVHPDHRTDAVIAAVRTALAAAFSFEARAFGQSVTRSEVLAAMQGVPGVEAVDLNQLRTNPGAVDPNPPRLAAETARWNAGAGSIDLAQLLVLAEGETAVTLTLLSP